MRESNGQARESGAYQRTNDRHKGVVPTRAHLLADDSGAGVACRCIAGLYRRYREIDENNTTSE